MPPDVLAATAAVLLAVVGLVGIMVPVVPGSLTIVAGLLVWAWWGGSPSGWLVFGLGGVCVLAGMAASWVLTGRSLKARAIPQWPILVGLAAGVVGMLVLPFLGFVLGFAGGVLVSEYVRVRDVHAALTTSVALIKAVGVGLVIELGLGLIAVTALLVSVGFHFLSR